MGSKEGGGKEKVEQVVRKPRGEEKRNPTRGPENKSSSRTERARAKGRGQENFQGKEQPKGRASKSASDKGGERLYYCSGSSSNFQHLRSQYHGRRTGSRSGRQQEENRTSRLDTTHRQPPESATKQPRPKKNSECDYDLHQFQLASTTATKEGKRATKEEKAPKKSKKEEKGRAQEQGGSSRPSRTTSATCKKQSCLSLWHGKRRRPTTPCSTSSSSSSTSSSSRSSSSDHHTTGAATPKPNTTSSSSRLILSGRADPGSSRYRSTCRSIGTIMRPESLCQDTTNADTASTSIAPHISSSTSRVEAGMRTHGKQCILSSTVAGKNFPHPPLRVGPGVNSMRPIWIQAFFFWGGFLGSFVDIIRYSVWDSQLQEPRYCGVAAREVVIVANFLWFWG